MKSLFSILKERKRDVFFIMALSIMFFLFIGCETKIEYVEINNTVVKIINSTVECQDVECVCSCAPQKECDVCNVTECDNTPYMKCQLQNGRYLSELNYLKNLTDIYTMNGTFEHMQHNITQCIKDKEEINKTITAILDLLNGT